MALLSAGTALGADLRGLGFFELLTVNDKLSYMLCGPPQTRQWLQFCGTKTKRGRKKGTEDLFYSLCISMSLGSVVGKVPFFAGNCRFLEEFRNSEFLRLQ